MVGWHCHINRKDPYGHLRSPVKMDSICFKRRRFPPDIIRHAVWLYARFTLSYRDVVDLFAERGLDNPPRKVTKPKPLDRILEDRGIERFLAFAPRLVLAFFHNPCPP